MNNDDYTLTTYNNPFNPFDDFISWWKFDMLYGFDTCGLLARTAMTDDLASDEQNENEINRAMDEIVEDYPMIYRKVKRSDFKNKRKLVKV